MQTRTGQKSPPDAAALRRFGLSVGALLALLFGALLPWWLGFTPSLWLWLGAGTLMLLALWRPLRLAPLERVWMRLALLLGAINTRIILALFFFLLLTPFGLLRRAFGRDPMRRGLDPAAPSYRQASTPRSRQHMERPF